MKITVLIVGAMGFIANAFIKSLISKSAKKNDNIYDIIGIDNMSYNSSYLNHFINKDFKFNIVDIKDKENLEKVFKLNTDLKNNKKIDIVLHLADGSRESEAISDPANHIQNNNYGLQNILDLSKKYGVNKFLYMSSYKIYGNNINGLSVETDNLKQTNIYTISKQMAESQIISSQIPYNILRTCDVIGTRQRPDFLLPKSTNDIINNIPIIINSKNEIREWLPVEDLVEAIKILIEENHENEIYNVSANYELSKVEMIYKIYQILNQPMNIEFIDDKLSNRYAIDSSKLKSIGWTPQMKFTSSLENYIVWYKTSKWWFNVNTNNI
jgi:dTDP-glucose 4,6-dehydratase